MNDGAGCSDDLLKCAKVEASVLKAIETANLIALIPHVSADGDALGSVFALRMILRRLGKTADVYCPTPIVKTLQFLKGAHEAKSASDALELASRYGQGMPYDLVIAVDSATCDRLGDCAVLFDHASDTMVIDHHSTNEGIARLDWIDKDAPATGTLVYDLARALNVSVDKDIAECLYTAVSTDTGNLTHRNTTAKAVRIVAACVDAGADVADLSERLHKMRTLNKSYLLARALGGIRALDGGRFISMRLTKEDFLQTGTDDSDTEGLIDFGAAVSGSVVAMIARERNDGIKISMRSRPPVDVAEIALCFDGGGHALAAGCTIVKPLDEAMALIEEKIIERLNAYDR